jgi:hypothetical protein
MSARLALFIPALFVLASCDGGPASNPAPPRLEEPLLLTEQPSTVRLPVSFPLADFQKLVNEEIPVELHKIDQPQQVCIKTKSKLLPDVSCRLVGSVTRGHITLTGRGTDIFLTMPVRAVVQARNIGKIVKQVNKGVNSPIGNMLFQQYLLDEDRPDREKRLDKLTEKINDKYQEHK